MGKREKINAFIKNFFITPKLWIEWKENPFESIWRLTWVISWAFLFFIKWNSENKILKSYLLHDAKKKIKKNIKKFKIFFNWKYYDFKGIKIPNVMWILWYWESFGQTYDDIFKIYVEMDDNYSYKILDPIENQFEEWPYCYISKDNAEITIKKWDVVIDAWARIGDFAAYASQKWAYTYAFEPSLKNIKYLEQTRDMNWKITIVPYWLWSKKEKIGFDDWDVSAWSYKFNKDTKKNIIQVTTLDDFVKENNISKIDFIKADIEWYERELLIWAKNVLKTQKPLISICTYHLHDDESVLKKIILDTNPEYRIIQKKQKLFAYIPEKHVKN